MRWLARVLRALCCVVLVAALAGVACGGTSTRVPRSPSRLTSLVDEIARILGLSTEEAETAVRNGALEAGTTEIRAAETMADDASRIRSMTTALQSSLAELAERARLREAVESTLCSMALSALAGNPPTSADAARTLAENLGTNLAPFSELVEVVTTFNSLAEGDSVASLALAEARYC